MTAQAANLAREYTLKNQQSEITPEFISELLADEEFINRFLKILDRIPNHPQVTYDQMHQSAETVFTRALEFLTLDESTLLLIMTDNELFTPLLTTETTENIDSQYYTYAQNTYLKGP